MLGHEDEGCVLAGNFTLLSTLAAGAAYIECCKGYPIWLPKPAYISTQDAAQTFTFIKSPAGSIPDISERSGCMLMLCFTNCICESFMQEKDKCLWPELSIIMDMLSQLTTFSDTRARWGCHYSHLLPNLSSPKQHTAELTSSLTPPQCIIVQQRDSVSFMPVHLVILKTPNFLLSSHPLNAYGGQRGRAKWSQLITEIHSLGSLPGASS